MSSLSSSPTPPWPRRTPALAPARERTAVERQVFAKIGWRLMPLLTTAYILNYLDRTNVSFAALTMNEAIGLTATQFGLGSGLFFFLGYCFLEVPSNVALYRFGPRRWLSRIMISWGLVSAAMSLAIGPNSFYVLRLLLGAAEAGFFPGVAFYLATWFPGEYRTRIIAWFMVAIPISSVIGGPVSGFLLALDGALGLAGWQWLFIVEGLPAVVVGFVLFTLLPDRPEDAAWLSDDERRIVRERLEAERRPKEVKRLALAFRDVRVLILAGVQFGFLVGSYGIGIFLPQILDTGRLSDVQIGFVTSGVLRGGQRHDDRLGRPRRSPRQQGGQPVRGLRASRRSGSSAPSRSRDNFWISVLLDHGRGQRRQRRAGAVLDDSAALPQRHGGRRRPGLHQLDRHHGRLRRTDDHGVAARLHRIVRGGADGARRIPARGLAARLVAQALRGGMTS